MAKIPKPRPRRRLHALKLIDPRFQSKVLPNKKGKGSYYSRKGRDAKVPPGLSFVRILRHTPMVNFSQ